MGGGTVLIRGHCRVPPAPLLATDRTAAYGDPVLGHQGAWQCGYVGCRDRINTFLRQVPATGRANSVRHRDVDRWGHEVGRWGLTIAEGPFARFATRALGRGRTSTLGKGRCLTLGRTLETLDFVLQRCVLGSQSCHLALLLDKLVLQLLEKRQQGISTQSCAILGRCHAEHCSP